MSEFTSLPLQKLLNKQNPISRIERLESTNGARPSATVGQLSQIAQNTGNLVVDGSIIQMNNATGAPNVTIDSNGVTFENNANYFSFRDTTGARNLYIYGSNDNTLVLANDKIGQAIKQQIKLTNATQPYVKFWEDLSNTNMAELQVNAGATAPTVVVIGGDNNAAVNAGVTIYANLDGKETVFNGTSYDIDHRFEGATDPKLLKLDAGLDAVGMGGDAETGYKLKVTGDVKITGKIDGTARTAFTPVLEGTATAGTGTYTTQLGEYAVMGDMVFYTIALVWTGHTGTGNMQINNLPFAASNNGMLYPAVVNWNNVTLAAAGNKVFAQLNPNTTIISLNEIGSGAASALPMDTAGVLRLSGWYFK